MSSRQRSRLLKNGGKDLLLEKELGKLQENLEKDDESSENSEGDELVNRIMTKKKLKKKQKKNQQKMNVALLMNSSSSESEDSKNDEAKSESERIEPEVKAEVDEHVEKEENDEDDNDSEQNEEEQFTLTKKQNFVFESEGSQHESSAESESDVLNLAALEQAKTLPQKPTEKETNEDENKLLEEMIEQNQQFLSLDASKSSEQDVFDEVTLLKLTDIDVKALDLDNIIRSRFGRNLDHNNNNNPAAGLDGEFDGGEVGGRGRRFRGLQAGRPNLHIGQKFGKKFIFGQMKEDWVKPPSFIGGGVGMEKISFDIWEEDSDEFDESDDDESDGEKSDSGDEIENENEDNDEMKREDTKSTINTEATADAKSNNNPTSLPKARKRGQKKNSRRFFSSKQQRNHHGRNNNNSSRHQHRFQKRYNELSKHIFTFHYSKEYQQLADQYEILLQSNDPNYLIMFLVNHPYFIRGFYDLSLIYLQMGQLDKTLHLLRRCIYCYENAFLESFKVCYGHNYLPLDIHPENKTFYAVFMKYLQLITNQGYYSLGLDLIRILLALSSSDSTEYGFLLFFDYYCLINKRFDLIFQMTGMKIYCKYVVKDYQSYQAELQAADLQKEIDEESNDVSDEKEEKRKSHFDGPVPSLKDLHEKIRNYPETGEEALFTMLDHWKHSYIIEVEEIQLEENRNNKQEKKHKKRKNNYTAEISDASNQEQQQEEVTAKKQLKETDMIVNLEYLPNWWFSLALACYLGHDDQRTRRKYQQGKTVHGEDQEEDESDEEEDDEEDLFDENNSSEDEQQDNKGKHRKASAKKKQKHHQQQSKEEPYLLSFYTLEHAKMFLLQAIIKWPSLYLQILKECFPHQTTTDYKFLTNHEFFRNSLASIKFPSTYNLPHIMKCQLIRMKGIYTSKPEIMEWFFQTGFTFLQWMDHPKKIVGTPKTPAIDPTKPLFPLIHAFQQQQLQIDGSFFARLIDNSIDTHQESIGDQNNTNYESQRSYKTLVIPTFQRYSSVKIENFLEEFPIFPNNLELIQPHLLDLTIFNGQMKFPELKKFIFVLKNYQKKFHSHQQAILNNWWAQLWQWLWGKQLTTRQLEGRDSWQWNLDLSIPLIQIFFLSFFPWYRVVPVVRHP